jgi:4-amino-4-deoxy-L-arabinose transferase-like glycosyltransferase
VTFVHKLTSRLWFWAVLAIVLMMGLKTWLAAGDRLPFNSDEAVVALMARHILQGARPVFFYGQAYMGSLNAFLVAGAFALFGQQVWAIRLVQALLYLGVLLTSAWLGCQAFGSWKVGVLAMFLLAIPAVNVTLYTTASLGGYGEALLLGNLILLTGMKIGEAIRVDRHSGALWHWALLGFLIGLGLWAFGLTLVYSLPVLAYLLALALWRLSADDQPVTGASPLEQSTVGATRARLPLKNLLLPALILAAGVLIGSAPWWGYALGNGFDRLISELGGGAIAGVEQLPWLLQVGRHIMGLGLLGMTAALGMRPPWEVYWLGLPLLPFVLFLWMAVLVYIGRSLSASHPNRASQALLVSVMLTLALGFILTPFGADPSGRYLLPLAVPLSLFAAAMIIELYHKYGVVAYSLAALLLVYNFWGNLQSALRFPPGITTQFYAPTQVDQRALPDLIDFLRQHDERRGYTNYWVTYPLAFHSQEDLIFIPSLPYHLDFRHTARDNRYAPYTEQVAQAQRLAYITTNHPDLNAYLRQQFIGQGVSWQEAQIGDFTVFYALSKQLRPEQLGLDKASKP